MEVLLRIPVLLTYSIFGNTQIVDEEQSPAFLSLSFAVLTSRIRDMLVVFSRNSYFEQDVGELIHDQCGNGARHILLYNVRFLPGCCNLNGYCFEKKVKKSEGCGRLDEILSREG